MLVSVFAAFEPGPESWITIPTIGTVNCPDTWAIVGPKDKIPEMQNIFWLFGNQNIPYEPKFWTVTSYEAIQDYAGLVTWTSLRNTYNFTAVKLFAKTRPVISHMFDFCHYMYPTLSDEMRAVHTDKVTFMADWGSFGEGDRTEMHNGTNYLTTVTDSGLSIFQNATVIAQYNSSRIALFHVPGDNDNAGFYVMDLHATRPNSYEAGNWHTFPVISRVSQIKVGRYSRWMSGGLWPWRSLDWIYDWMTNFTQRNGDFVSMQSIGTSIQGRAINALFIGKGTRNLIADAAIHGDEKTGTHAILRFAELLEQWYRNDAGWQQKLSQYRIILIPVLNPDGYVAHARCNAHGEDLNRQFPPETQTTEPEAWALRWLMGNYTPVLYVTLHVGGQYYPLDVFYPGWSVDPYRKYTRWAAQQSDLDFQDLQHWGTKYDVWVGSYDQIAPSGFREMSSEYAFYAHNSTSLLLEQFGGMPNSQLYGQEFYITAMLGLLLHHDRTSGFMLHSNAFIVSTKYTIYDVENLMAEIDATAPDQVTDTRILDLEGHGKPYYVYIDGSLKAEGEGWSWDSMTNTTTVTVATESIVLVWGS